MKSYLAALVASLVYPLAVQASKVLETTLQAGLGEPLIQAGEFDDNTQGYCFSNSTGKDGLRQLQITDLLTKTHVEDIDIFFQANGFLTPYLSEFIQTVVAYLPSAVDPSNVLLVDTLESVMIKQAEGPERSIQSDCIDVLLNAQTQALLDFFFLMGFGNVFELPVDEHLQLLSEKLEEQLQAYNPNDEFVHEGDTNIRLAMSHYLHAIETETDSFERFFKSFIAFYEAFGEFNLFNDWVNQVATWEELALTPMSLVGKFAAVCLTNGADLRAAFETQGFATRLNRLYDLAVDICNLPTSEPSMAPSFGVSTFNQFLPVLAVVDQTLESAATIQASYDSFRATYPDRFICLVQIRTFDADDIQVPLDFVVNDDQKEYLKVNADYGEPFYQQDWYDLCGLKAFEDNPFVDKVPVYVGVNEDLVEASLSYFEQMVTMKIGTTPRAPSDSRLNYFDALNRNF